MKTKYDFSRGLGDELNIIPSLTGLKMSLDIFVRSFLFVQKKVRDVTWNDTILGTFRKLDFLSFLAIQMHNPCQDQQICFAILGLNCSVARIELKKSLLVQSYS